MSHTNVKKVNNDSTDYDLPVLRRLAKLQRPQTAHGVPLTWLETEKRVGLTGNGGPSGQLLVGSVDRATTPMKRNPIPKSRPTSALPNSVSNSMSVDSSEPVATKALFRTTTIEKSSSCGEYEPAAKSLASPLPARPRPHTSTGTRDRSPGMKRITRGVGCGEGNINRSVAASPTSRSHSPCRPTSPSKLHSSSMLSLPSSTSRPISVTQKISFLMAEVELAKQRSKLLPPEVFKKYMEENSTMCKNERKMKIGTGINQSSVDSTGDFNFFDDDFEGLNSCRSNGSSSSRRPVSSSGWGANHLIRLFRDPEESGSCKNSKSGGNSSRKEVKSALRPRTAPGGLGENQGLSHIEATDGSTTSRSALKSGRSIGKGNISARSNVSVQFSDDVKLNSKPNPNLKSLPSRQVLKSGGSAFSNECVKSTGSVGVAMQLDNSPVLAKAADGSDNFRTPPTTPPSGGGRKRAQSISVSPQVVKSKIFFPDSEATKSPGGSARHDLTDNDAREEAIRVNREMRAAAMKIVRTVQAISAQIEEHPDGNVFDSLPDAEKDMFTKYKHATLNNVFQSLVLMETTRSYESSSDWLSYRDSMNSISRGGSSLASRTQDRIEAAKKRKKDSEAAEKRAMMEKVNERKRKRLQAQMEENRRIVQKQWLLYCRVLATAK